MHAASPRNAYLRIRSLALTAGNQGTFGHVTECVRPVSPRVNELVDELSKLEKCTRTLVTRFVSIFDALKKIQVLRLQQTGGQQMATWTWAKKISKMNERVSK